MSDAEQSPPPLIKRTTEVYRVLAVAFGGLLIVAGLAKLLVIGPPAASGVFMLLLPSWALATVPVYEIVLGGWLLSGRWRFGAWLAALATLGVFCLVNLESVAGPASRVAAASARRVRCRA